MKATAKQIRLFFLLSKQLGYEAEFIKEAGKKQFNLEHLTDATSEQISYLIDKLQEKIHEN